MQSTKKRLNEAFYGQLGSEIRDALERPDVLEVLVNDDGVIRLDTIGKGRVETASKISPEVADAIIRLVANHVGAMVNGQHPLVSGTIPETGERFQGILPPVSKVPTFSIRKRPGSIFRLTDYIEAGSATHSQVDMLVDAIKQRKNILVSGGASSGKTTFLNALLSEPAFVEDRVVLIEDTRELQCSAKDQVPLLTLRTAPEITIRSLVQTALRMRPDRIVVGEIRDGGGAQEMLKAWNTGHDGGLGTLHANTAREALYRLEDLLSEVSASVPRRLIAGAVDIVVHLKRLPNGRRIDEIITVQGSAGDDYLTQPACCQEDNEDDGPKKLKYHEENADHLGI